MPAKPLEARVRHRRGGVVIDLDGEVDDLAEATLDRAYAEAEKHEPEAILLIFTGVRYINSTGIALIVGLLATARASKRHLLASGLSDHYAEIFSVTRLTDFVHVFPDEERAMRGATRR